MVWYWAIADVEHRAWALAKIAARANAEGVHQVSWACAGLLADPSKFAGDMHSPPGIDPAIRPGLTLPLGFVADWAFQKAFD